MAHFVARCVAHFVAHSVAAWGVGDAERWMGWGRNNGPTREGVQPREMGADGGREWEGPRRGILLGMGTEFSSA